jgi:hypothetical protein
MKYWINDWAKFRMDEVVRVPTDYKIHPGFTLYADETDIRAAFVQLNALFADIYNGMAETPEAFGLPLREKEKFRWFSKEWLDSGQAPYRPFILLYNLLTCGDICGNTVVVPAEKFKSIKPPPKHLSGIEQKTPNAHFLFGKLADYGFVFEGLKNNKVTEADIAISYPDNGVLLLLLKQLADKARGTGKLGDFLCCSFRLLQDDMQTVGYGCVEDLVDKVHTSAEKDFVQKMDKVLLDMGLFCGVRGGYEGPGLAYYRTEKGMNTLAPYSFRMVASSPDIFNPEARGLQLGLRIRNVTNCLEYLENCPEEVNRIFIGKSDVGCGKRQDDSCKHGVSYEMDGETYWRCGCCHTAFHIKPEAAHIPHYINLVALGEKK